jgi:pimeloyl-ACP methyl ester carboxylesterase
VTTKNIKSGDFMKSFKYTLGALLIGAVVLGVSGNAKMGKAVFQAATTIESKLYGLQKQTITVDGIPTVAYISGDASKPAIIMLHGFSADKDVWPRFAKAFTKDYFVVIPDMAGHGETGFKAAWAYDAPSQAQRIVGLMDALKIPKAHVVGNSMGGFIAATLSANASDRIISVVAIDPAGVSGPTESAVVKQMDAGNNPFLVKTRAEFDSFYATTMAQPPWLPDMVVAAMAEGYIEKREQLAAIHAGFHKKNPLDDRLADIKTPFLLIWGKKDQVLDVSAAPVWKAGIAQAEVVVFDDLGHMPMVEAPEKTATVVSAFLQKGK